MTTAPLLPPPSSPADSEPPPARISFRQPVATTGYIDAAWWPRTLDLTAELPPLMDVMWSAAREVNRVSYNLHAWDRAPRRMTIEGRTVRLGGFNTSDPLTVSLSGEWGQERIDILVIAPDTSPAVADQAFRIASTVGDQLRAGEILQQAKDNASHDPANRS